MLKTVVVRFPAVHLEARKTALHRPASSDHATGGLGRLSLGLPLRGPTWPVGAVSPAPAQLFRNATFAACRPERQPGRYQTVTQGSPHGY